MWVELRTVRGDLLREAALENEFPNPGKVLMVGPDAVRVLGTYVRTERRVDELAGVIDVAVVEAELIPKPSKRVPMPPREKPRALNMAAA